MPRDIRQSRNREIFRAVNQRIADIAAGFDVVSETQGFICECSQLGCSDQIQLPLDVYSRVLATSAYLVREGHEDTTSEEVVEAGGGYLIVIERHD